jgi:hypothetical protein
MVTKREIPTSKKLKARISLRSVLIGIAVLSVLLASFSALDRKFGEPSRRARDVERHLEMLEVRQPPPGLTHNQWQTALFWTINLHGNSRIRYEADGPTIAAFEERLVAKLAGDVTIDTIYWIWDEYARICPGGARYNNRFRSIMLEDIAANRSNGF